MNFQKFVKFVWIGVCLLLFLWEIFKITCDYCSHVTSTQAIYLKDSEYPTITICANVRSVLSKIIELNSIRNSSLRFTKGYDCVAILRGSSWKLDRIVMPSESFRAEIYLNSIPRLPFGRSFPTQEVQYLAGYIIFVPFSRQQITLLPTPYPSNCLDYTTVGFLSQPHCFEACICKNRSHLPVAYASCKVPSSFHLSHCTTKCSRPHCAQELFLSTESSEIQSVNTTLVLYESSRSINLLMSPVFSFERYCICIVGLAGTHLGFCVYDVGKYMRRARRDLIRHLRFIMLRSKKIFRLLLISICLSGLLYQYIDLANIYLLYSVTTELYIGKPMVSVIPSVILCFDIKYLIRNPHLTDSNCETCLQRYSQIHQMTPNLYDLIYQIKSFTQNGEYRSLINNSDTFYYKDQKCFKLLTTTDIPERISKENFHNHSYQYDITFKNPIHCLVYLRGIRDWIIGSENIAGFKLLSSFHPSHHLQYEVLDLNLLRYPYPSDCVGYLGNIHRSSCLQSCMPSDWPKESRFPYNDYIYKNSEEISFTGEISFCKKRCKQECKQNRFVISHHRYTSRKTNDLSIPPTAYTNQYNLQPQTTILQFLILLANDVNFWIGLSLASLCTLAVRRIRHKMNSKANPLFTRQIQSTVWVIRTQKHRLPRFLKTILHAIIWIGFLYQVATILMQYLEYFVFTETNLKLIRIAAPSFSVCVDYRRYLRRGNILLPNSSAQYLNNHTADLLSILDIYVINTTNKYYQLYISNGHVHSVKLQVYFMCNLKCIEISNITSYFSYHLREIYTSKSAPYLIYLKTNWKIDVGLIVSDANSFYSRKVQAKVNSWGRGITFHNTLITNNFLPSPYKTNCLEYSRTKYFSQKNCLETCILKKMYSNHRLLYYRGCRLAYSNISGNVVDYPTTEVNMYCNDICKRISCTTNTYYVRLDRFVYHRVLFGILATKSQIITNYTPKMTIPDLFLYVLGIIALWFGADLLSLYDVVLHTIFKRGSRSRKRLLETVIS